MKILTYTMISLASVILAQMLMPQYEGISIWFGMLSCFSGIIAIFYFIIENTVK